MKKCCVCKKEQKKGNGAFFSVPQGERRMKWAKICSLNFSRDALICMDHFSPSSFVQTGRKYMLLPCAVPIMPVMDRMPATAESYKEKQINQNSCDIVASSYCSKKVSHCIPVSNFVKNQSHFVDKLLPSAVAIKTDNVLPPQLHEEALIEIPTTKSDAMQTNKNICGIIEALKLPEEFCINCFYCSEVFPLERFKQFVNHLSDKHYELETSFKRPNYVTENDDYTSLTSSTSNAEESDLEIVDINTNSTQKLVDPLENTNKPIESNSIICETLDKSNTISNNTVVTNICIKSDSTMPKLTSKRPALSLNRSNTEAKELQVKDSDFLEIVHPLPTEITFEYTPREIVESLLDNMKNYPILWQFDNERFNEDFFEAVEDLCNIINEKWSLHIDNLKMRRSINRIIRFYCYLYPNTNVENIDQFTSYYDKCAYFLPSTINEIAYARCSHCYICYKNDYDLKRHLLEEYNYLQWPYKCIQCKECFRESDDYEFHKSLPHYDEIFRCDQCSKTFFRRNIYNQHVAERHPSNSNENKHKCNICSKTYKTKKGLHAHKKCHGERKYKCHLCPKSYFEKGLLTIHLRSHGKEYKLVCEVCGKGFYTKKALGVHMKKHTGEKVTCSICNLKLRKSSLSRHMRLQHVAYERNIEPTIRRRKPYPLRQKKECEEINYYCYICKMSFENYIVLLEHNEAIHFSHIQKWTCEICSTDLSKKAGLKRHYRRTHKLDLIQIHKLVDQHEDLNVVLSSNKEYLKLNEKFSSKNNIINIKPNIKTEIKVDLLSDESSVVEEKLDISIIQDEIMNDDDNIVMEDYFTEYLEEEP